MIIVSMEWDENQQDLEIHYIGSKDRPQQSIYAKTLIDGIKGYYPQYFHEHDYPEYSLLELNIAVLKRLLEEY